MVMFYTLMVINGLVLIVIIFIKMPGQVGFLIKNVICNEFNISVLDCSFEGIMWLKMYRKSDNCVIMPCVCYLPPENSSRRIDVNSFYDNLLTGIYRNQNEGTVFICGDFNSRCGDLDDFINGVDNIPIRNVVDFKTNSYGELFVDFMINANMCMLNGRNCTNND